MIQTWNLRSRAHHCALSERPFVDGETHYTAIYLDPKTAEYTRRDIALEVWAQEQTERTAIAKWKTIYHKTLTEAKPDITSRESPLTLLQRLVDEDKSYTENARYILAAMLERKRILSQTAVKENDQGDKMLFYENKKTGDVYIIRDPELRLDELASVQEEVATLLGFTSPGQPPAGKPGVATAVAAAAVAVTIDAPAVEPPPAPEAEQAQADQAEDPSAPSDPSKEVQEQEPEEEDEDELDDEDEDEDELEEDLEEEADEELDEDEEDEADEVLEEELEDEDEDDEEDWEEIEVLEEEDDEDED